MKQANLVENHELRMDERSLRDEIGTAYAGCKDGQPHSYTCRGLGLQSGQSPITTVAVLAWQFDVRGSGHACQPTLPVEGFLCI